jgi:hypothetical protein
MIHAILDMMIFEAFNLVPTPFWALRRHELTFVFVVRI